MEHDFFTNLPTEIMIDIFSRLPPQSIMSCKCVCKSWRYLIKTPEFVDSQFSRSVPCLALFQSKRFLKRYKIIEFVDTQNSWQNQCNVVLNFSFPHQAIIQSSANGLLFLSNIYYRDLFICNPITCEYVKLPPKLEVADIESPEYFGFGVSKLSGEYKVVRLFNLDIDHQLIIRCKCEVYSLKRGLWRRVETAADQLRWCQVVSGPISLNGNLHLLVCSSYVNTRNQMILCFDLETECFSTFSIPHPYLDNRSMCALGDRLCLCDYTRNGFVIWLMNKYGDEKSWTKEFIIDLQGHNQLRGGVVPIKVFKDGDILFLMNQQYVSDLYRYSSKTRTIRKIDAVESFFEFGTISGFYTPSFIPLKTLTTEHNIVIF